MRRRSAIHWVAVTLATFALGACAHAQPPHPFSKPVWKVARVSCPAGCAQTTLRFLRNQIGRSVQLSTTSLEAPFLDKCEGAVRWEVRDSALATVIDELNRGIAPDARRISPADLETSPKPQIGNGVAMCSGRFGDLTMARAPVIARDRIVLLFEEHSLIELR